jgi:hypothetical protein
MKYYQYSFILIFVPILLFPCLMPAQSWNFKKEEDGIKIYTRQEAGKSLKSYKGVVDIHAQASEVLALLENANDRDWWDKNIKQVKVLLYEKNKRAQFYMVYDLPWPVEDRDLCVDATVNIDPVTGVSQVTSFPLPGCAPQNNDMIRIKDYRQTWIVKPTGKESAHVVLEGYLDPAGSIPDWITNMLIVDSPVKVMSAVRQRLEKKR